jgi:hypothetical protein
MQFDDIDGVLHYFTRNENGGDEVFEVRDSNTELVNSVRTFIQESIVKSHNNNDLSSLLKGLELSTEILDESNFNSEKIEVTYKELPNGGMASYNCINEEMRKQLYLWFNFLFFSDLRNPIRKSLLIGGPSKTLSLSAEIKELIINTDSNSISQAQKTMIHDISELLNANVKFCGNNLIFIPLTSKKAAVETLEKLNSSFTGKINNYEGDLYFFSLTNSLDLIGFKPLLDELGNTYKKFINNQPWSFEISGAEAKGFNNYLVLSLDTLS